MTTYEQIKNVQLENVPVMTTVRGVARKEQSALARKLFKKLGIKGISVTTPNYSMARVCYVIIKHPAHPGFDGYKEFSHCSYSEMPEHVPARQWMNAKIEADRTVTAILEKAFPSETKCEWMIS